MLAPRNIPASASVLMSERVWQHPWLRIQRLIRSITQERWHPAAKPLMKEMTFAARVSTVYPDSLIAHERTSGVMGILAML